jgi:acylphosphatase
MPDRVRVLIKGRVQAVGYRYATHAQAVARGVTGWVRNCPDGSVEAEFEGETECLEAIIQWCEQGPPLAQVQEVSTEWSRDVRPTYRGFDIKH